MSNGSHAPLECIEHAGANDPALRDELTGLPNSALWSGRAGAALREAARSGRRLAVLHIAIDNFTRISDEAGRDVSDALLREVARRLQDVVRPYDTVAPTGEGGFLILCPLLSRGDDGEPLARRLQAAMDAPVLVPGSRIEVTVSIGIAFAEDGEVEPRRVMDRAGAALRAARERGGACFESFVPDRRDRTGRSANVLVELEHAHANGEFVVFYQPIVEAASRRVVAVEALLRWENPEVGILTPRFFMDVLGASELMHEVGAAVLRTACGAVADLMVRGHRVDVHVNVSAPEIARPGLAARVRAALEESGLPAEFLVLEIAESDLMGVADAALDELAEVREAGVRIAVDHVGTRSSRTTHLAGLPIDAVKLDMEIVSDILASASARAVSSGIRTAASGLRVAAMAAGVESEAQAVMLERLGFGRLQGHVFGLPAPLSQLDGSFR